MYIIALGSFATQSLAFFGIPYIQQLYLHQENKKFDGPSTEDEYVNVIEEVCIYVEGIN